MNKKTKKINLIFCLAAFAVMLIYMFFADGPEVFKSLGKIKLGFLIIAFIFMIIYWLLEGLGLHLLLKPLHKPQRFKDTMTVTMIGQYVNCITPFASGGQPIQAYYVISFGVPLSACMTALLSRFIIYQFVLTAYTFVLLFTRLSVFAGEQKLLAFLTVIGFIINSAVLAGLLMLAFFKRGTKKIVHVVLRLLAKLRIVKNYKKRRRFMDEEMDSYHKNFEAIKKQPLLMIRLIFLTVVQMTFYYGITYIIYLGFGLSEADPLTIISCQSFVMLISGYVPLPGAAGAAESIYGLFLGRFFGSYVTLSTFIWRFLTFYFTIITGFAVTLFIDKKLNREKQTNNTVL